MRTIKVEEEHFRKRGDTEPLKRKGNGGNLAEKWENETKG